MPKLKSLRKKKIKPEEIISEEPTEETRIRERFGFEEALKLTEEEAEEFASGLPPKSKALFEEEYANQK